MKEEGLIGGPLIEVMRGQRATEEEESSLNETWRNAKHKFPLGNWR